jgi:hypothetical protein
MGSMSDWTCRAAARSFGAGVQGAYPEDDQGGTGYNPPVIAMNRQLIRRLALALIAFLAFAQASTVLAACAMDRGEMGAMMAQTDESGAAGEGCCAPAPVQSPQAQVANNCFAHCTADLQLTGYPVLLVQAPAATPVLRLPELERSFPGRAVLEAPPPPTITSRILLHSFLI